MLVLYFCTGCVHRQTDRQTLANPTFFILVSFYGKKIPEFCYTMLAATGQIKLQLISGAYNSTAGQFLVSRKIIRRFI